MPIYLRQSTASQEIPLGQFVSDTDGKTAATALTIANTDIKLWLTGAITLANKNAGGATHISNGIYYAVLDATDTATIGSLIIFVNPTGALGVRVECVVLATAIYDELFGTTAIGTAYGALKPTTAGRTLDVAATGEAGLDFANINQATGATTLTNIRIPNVTLVDTITTYTGNTPQTGDNFARIGANGAGLTSLLQASSYVAPNNAGIAALLAGVNVVSWNGTAPANLHNGYVQADTREINNTTVLGTGISADLWRG